jgi:hypothetical protein
MAAMAGDGWMLQGSTWRRVDPLIFSSPIRDLKSLHTNLGVRKLGAGI